MNLNLFKYCKFVSLHFRISVDYLEFHSHFKCKRLHSHICYFIVQVHSMLPHFCQSLGN